MNIPELNRSIVVVRPKRPYVEWANTYDDGPTKLTPENLPNWASIYLIPEFEDEEGVRRILRDYYQRIFENELWGWTTDKNTWPEKRNFQTFKEWFHCEFHDLVVDLGEDNLERF